MSSIHKILIDQSLTLIFKRRKFQKMVWLKISIKYVKKLYVVYFFLYWKISFQKISSSEKKDNFLLLYKNRVAFAPAFGSEPLARIINTQSFIWVITSWGYQSNN